MSEAKAQEPILSTDDLVMEIGVLHVKLMEKERQIELLRKQIEELEKLREENQALKTSNHLLNQRSHELDRALTQARLEIERLQALVRKYEEKESMKKRKKRG